jgi:hypothetical protein
VDIPDTPRSHLRKGAVHDRKGELAEAGMHLGARKQHIVSEK